MDDEYVRPPSGKQQEIISLFAHHRYDKWTMTTSDGRPHETQLSGLDRHVCLVFGLRRKPSDLKKPTQRSIVDELTSP